MRTISELKAELKHVIDAGLEAGGRGDAVAVKAADEQAAVLYGELRGLERERAIGMIGVATTTAPSLESPLLKAMAAQEFNVKEQPRVQVGALDALGVELKAGSFDGTIGVDTLPEVVPAPALGADSRFLFPRVPTVPVAIDVANVASYRQKQRTLATPGDMIRSIDDITAKPETSTQSEVTALPLSQVATVSTQIPAILFESQSFAGWVRNDVELAWRYAIDSMIVDAVNGSGASGALGSGDNSFEDLLYAEETVRAGGHQPDTIVLSPGDALAIQLLQLTGGDTYVFRPAPPTIVVSPSVGDGGGFVMDASSALTLYASPTRFETFPENFGQTNSYTARYENNAGVQIHRAGAICLLSTS